MVLKHLTEVTHNLGEWKHKGGEKKLKTGHCCQIWGWILNCSGYWGFCNCTGWCTGIRLFQRFLYLHLHPYKNKYTESRAASSPHPSGGCKQASSSSTTASQQSIPGGPEPWRGPIGNLCATLITSFLAMRKWRAVVNMSEDFIQLTADPS